MVRGWTGGAPGLVREKSESSLEGVKLKVDNGQVLGHGFLCPAVDGEYALGIVTRNAAIPTAVISKLETDDLWNHTVYAATAPQLVTSDALTNTIALIHQPREESREIPPRAPANQLTPANDDHPTGRELGFTRGAWGGFGTRKWQGECGFGGRTQSPTPQRVCPSFVSLVAFCDEPGSSPLLWPG